MVEVSLDHYELLACSNLGLARAHQSILLRSQERLAATSWIENLTKHVIGAMGERAVCKYLNLYNAGSINVWKGEPDIHIPTKFGMRKGEVRTRSVDKWDLILRDDDDPESIYFLCTGKGPVIKIHGWILGRTGKKDKWVANHGYTKPAYFVPATELNNPEILQKFTVRRIDE